MVATCGGETRNPQITIPRAAKAFAGRLLVCYVISVFGLTLTCPSDAPELVSGGAGAGSSPFVIGIMTAGIKLLDHIVNSIILCSAWSAGNVYMYLGSRSIYSLAVAGNAPKIFTRCTRSGIPYYAVAASALWAPLAYLNVSDSGANVFSWFINIM